MANATVAEIFKNPEQYINKSVTVSGWVRTTRDSKVLGFIELNDGSFFKSIQIVFEEAVIDNFKEIAKLPVGAAIIAEGTLVETPNAKQPFEIKASRIEIEGNCTLDYPLQKKRHGFEFLRTISHLRPRTNTFSAVFRVRSLIAYAIHKFFNERGFVYVHTPIITGNDCEGAGQMFRVTTLDINNLPKTPEGHINFSEDFFGKETSLTVSGQLEGETFCMAFNKIYIFGPTFRAENSNTSRHAAEFWMIEPEVAFADLNSNMALAEDMLKFIIKYCLS